MRKVLFQPKGNVFFSWLGSYMLVLLIPLLITFYAFYQSIFAVEDEIDKAQMASLKQLREVIDGKLRDMKKISMEIGMSENSKAIMYMTEDLEPMERLTVLGLKKDLTKYVAPLSYIDNLSIYYKNSGIILSCNGTNTVQGFFDFYMQSSGITFGEWFSEISSSHMQDYTAYNRNGKSTLLYMQSLPIEAPGSSEATLTITVNEDAFKNQINEAKWLKEGSIFILDKDGNMVASTSQAPLPDNLSQDRMLREDGIFNENIGGEDCVISYTSSNVNQWKYVSTIPTSVFLQKSQYIRKVMTLTIVLYLLIGLSIAFVFSKKNYTPVRRLAQIFNNRSGEQNGRKHVGYDYIEESIMNIIDRNGEISRRLDQQNKLLRDNFISRLLKGNVGSGISVNEALSSYDISFPHDHFIVALFCFENLNGNFFDNGGETVSASLEMDTDKIIDFIGRELPAGCVNSVLDMDGMICCLVNAENTEEGSLEQVIDTVAQKTIEYAENAIGVYMAVAISNVNKKTIGIHTAYQEAVETIEQKRLLGGGQILHYRDISARGWKNNNYYKIEEKQLTNCLKGEDYKGARAILDNAIRETFYGAPVSSHMTRFRMYGLMYVVFYALMECSAAIDKSLTERLEEHLLDCKTVKELQQQANRMIDEIEAFTEKRKTSRTSNLIDSIKEYVNERYHDVNLSISVIAGELNMNDAYLSRFFKKQTGGGLLEYIHKVRIEKAKQLLKEQEISIKDVSTKVGFYNSVAFIRSFKKCEGITPGKYIEMQGSEL